MDIQNRWKPLIGAWILFGLILTGLSGKSPGGFLEQETIQSTQVREGLTWYKMKGMRDGMKLEIHLLEIDSSSGNFSLQPVVGGASAGAWGIQFFQRSRPSRFLADYDLQAVLNASFFDIRGTQSPTGLLIKKGEILREPHASRVALLFLQEGGLRIAKPGWEGELIYGESRIPLRGVNHPGAAKEGAMMYRPPWVRTLGVDAVFLKEAPEYELVLKQEGLRLLDEESDWTVMSGVVVERLERQSSRPLAPDEFCLVPYGEEAQALLKRSPGERLEVRWRLTDLPKGIGFHQIREAVSAGPVLVREGEVQSGTSGFWTTRHPRSAIGWSEDQNTVWWVLVDGRSQRSAGMSLHTLGMFFEHLQASDALNLDGGGSSALALDLPGGPKVVNRPSDGRERYIPTAIGLRVEVQDEAK